MLKVKDGIDLKELEKFGFVKSDKFEKDILYKFIEWGNRYRTVITVKGDRTISLPYITLATIDLLFDLIISGYVEKYKYTDFQGITMLNMKDRHGDLPPQFISLED